CLHSVRHVPVKPDPFQTRDNKEDDRRLTSLAAEVEINMAAKPVTSVALDKSPNSKPGNPDLSG
ncbi:hypothetical protein BaRGS_00040398, partial [Batillaria attramentaria]